MLEDRGSGPLSGRYIDASSLRWVRSSLRSIAEDIRFRETFPSTVVVLRTTVWSIPAKQWMIQPGRVFEWNRNVVWYEKSKAPALCTLIFSKMCLDLGQVCFYLNVYHHLYCASANASSRKPTPSAASAKWNNTRVCTQQDKSEIRVYAAQTWDYTHGVCIISWLWSSQMCSRWQESPCTSMVRLIWWLIMSALVLKKSDPMIPCVSYCF